MSDFASTFFDGTDSVREKIRRVIYGERAQRGWSVEDLSRISRLSEGVIRALEAGILPPRSSVLTLLNIFDLSLDDVLRLPLPIDRDPALIGRWKEYMQKNGIRALASSSGGSIPNPSLTVTDREFEAFICLKSLDEVCPHDDDERSNDATLDELVRYERALLLQRYRQADVDEPSPSI